MLVTGEDDDGVCLDQDGQLLVCGVGSNASVRFGQWDVVECSVDYDEGCIKFAVNGTPIDESVSLADNPALKYPLCPALAIKAPCAVELQVCTVLGVGQGCIRREGTSEAAPEAVRQALRGRCQSGCLRLLSVTYAIEAGTWRQGYSGRA